MNKLVKTVSKENLYLEYLKSLNGILQLTEREQQLMVKFIEFDLSFEPAPGVAKNVANTKNRKRIRAELGVTPDNLSRYIAKLKRDGLLVKGVAEDELIVNKILIPEVIKDRIQVTIILKVDDTKKETGNIHSTSEQV